MDICLLIDIEFGVRFRDFLLQMDQLEYVLGRLSAAPEVWQAPMFSQAWQTMLITPLTKG